MKGVAGLFDAEELHSQLQNLGSLVWYTVHEAAPTKDNIRDALRSSRLDEAWMPHDIFPRDAFRRATSNVEKHRIPVDGHPDQFVNLLIREVSKDNERVVRHLVKEVVDSANVRLSYTETARLTLDLTGGAPRVNATPLVDDLSAVEAETVKEAEEGFYHAVSHYDGRTIREIVHRVLLTTAPVAVKSSGGVYFVSRDQAPTVQALRDFVPAVTAQNGSRVWAMPVYDDGDARAMIQDSLAAHVEDEGLKVVNDLTRLLREGSVSDGTLKACIDRVSELSRRTEAYERLLGEHAEAARTALEIAREQVKTIWSAAMEEVPAAQ